MEFLSCTGCRPTACLSITKDWSLITGKLGARVAKWEEGDKEFRDCNMVINYGDGGLQNGKMAGPKLFAPPPSKIEFNL